MSIEHRTTLKEALINKRMSQKELADALSVSPPLINKYTTGTTTPGDTNKQRIESYMGCGRLLWPDEAKEYYESTSRIEKDEKIAILSETVKTMQNKINHLQENNRRLLRMQVASEYYVKEARELNHFLNQAYLALENDVETHYPLEKNVLQNPPEEQKDPMKDLPLS